MKVRVIVEIDNKLEEYILEVHSSNYDEIKEYARKYIDALMDLQHIHNYRILDVIVVRK